MLSSPGEIFAMEDNDNDHDDHDDDDDDNNDAKTSDATNGFDCSGEEGGGGGLLGEEECEVEDRELSIAVVAAAANANPQPASSIILDKMHGGEAHERVREHHRHLCFYFFRQQR